LRDLIVPAEKAQARAYVALQQIESRWQAMYAGERLRNSTASLIPAVAIGNARLIENEAQRFDQALGALLDGEMDRTTRREAEILRTHVKEIIMQCHELIKSRDEAEWQIPSTASTNMSGWTAEELFTVFHPLYPNLQSDKDHNDLIRLVFNEIRRVPNPDFEDRFSKDPRRAAEYLFDRTDALIYAAKRWGGPECRFQAKAARDELGWLRDFRYVLPALRAENVRVRLTGIACLAFLWSSEGNEHLEQLATGDPEPGVRQSALWAYGFAGGEDAQELLRDRSRNDANIHVRAFAKKAMQLDERGWWGL
jgi:hypothetical protein